MPELTELQQLLDLSSMNRGLVAIESDSKWEISIRRMIWDRVLRCVDMDTEVSLLDIGCGTGRAVGEAHDLIRRSLAEKGRVNVKVKAIGIDKNPIPHLVRHNHEKEGFFDGVELLEGDAMSLENIPDESVDVGWSFATLQYVDDPLKALESGYRVLKPGGKLVWFVNDLAEPNPTFSTIFENSPGASSVFKYSHFQREVLGNFITCVKPAEKVFNGFSYNLERVETPIFSPEIEKSWGTANRGILSHYKVATYRQK